METKKRPEEAAIETLGNLLGLVVWGGGFLFFAAWAVLAVIWVIGRAF